MTIVKNQSLAEEITQNTFYKALTARHGYKGKSREFTWQIHLVLHELQEPYKEVFQLRVFGELSFSQIGIIFGKTENWARVTYHRARLKIKERMDHYES